MGIFLTNLQYHKVGETPRCCHHVLSSNMVASSHLLSIWAFIGCTVNVLTRKLELIFHLSKSRCAFARRQVHSLGRLNLTTFSRHRPGPLHQEVAFKRLGGVLGHHRCHCHHWTSWKFFAAFHEMSSYLRHGVVVSSSDIVGCVRGKSGAPRVFQCIFFFKDLTGVGFDTLLCVGLRIRDSNFCTPPLGCFEGN